MSDDFNNGNGQGPNGNNSNGYPPGGYPPGGGGYPPGGYHNPNDIPSTAINIVSCCFPIVGLILFLVWKDSKPISSKAVGKWALIGFIIGVVGYVISALLGFGFMAALGGAGYY